MILWLALILAAVLFRTATPHLDGLANFAPLMAITLCASIYLPRKVALLVPLSTLLISDLILNHHYQSPLFQPFMFATYACYIAAGFLGLWIATKKNLWTILGGCLASTALFYLVTNSLAWISNPLYAPTLAGWFQALTLGLPGLPPTYTFLRNSLLSDLTFTALFVASMEWQASKNGLPHLPFFHYISTPKPKLKA
jgi:hypothetical protein